MELDAISYALALQHVFTTLPEAIELPDIGRVEASAFEVAQEPTPLWRADLAKFCSELRIGEEAGMVRCGQLADEIAPRLGQLQ